jgi:RNA polymerase sigma factor (sigma-70 family)
VGRVFLGVAQDRFRHEGSLEAYARSVARYTCLEHLRYVRSVRTLGPQELASRDRGRTPDDAVSGKEKLRDDLRCLASLSVDCLSLLRMIFVDRLSYSETARRLGISEGALRVRLHRCRTRLEENRRRGSDTPETVDADRSTRRSR